MAVALVQGIKQIPGNFIPITLFCTSLPLYRKKCNGFICGIICFILKRNAILNHEDSI